MQTMQAIIFEKINDFDSLKLKEVPYPKPAANEVVVKIKANALNHRDVWIIQGLYPGVEVPVILGSDGAGIVTEVSSDLSDDWLNQDVIINPAIDWGEQSAAQDKTFQILGLPRNGTQAQYISVPVENLAKKPKHLSFAEAAALPLAALTAYRALFIQGQLKQHETVIISGFGGGVASLATKFSIAANARVIVTSSDADKLTIAKKLGVKAGLNYHSESFVDDAINAVGNHGVDLIIDGAGGDNINKFLDILNPGGRLISYGATAGNPNNLDMFKLFWKQIRFQGSTMGSPKDFADMLAFVEKHKIKPYIDNVYPLDNYKQAYERMLQSKQMGKIVIEM